MFFYEIFFKYLRILQENVSKKTYFIEDLTKTFNIIMRAISTWVSEVDHSHVISLNIFP